MVCDYLLKRHRKMVIGLAFLVVVLLLLTSTPPGVLHLKSAIVDRASSLYSIDDQYADGAGASTAYVVDYMTEEDALKLRACKDPKLAADTKTSKLSIHGSTKGVYRLGDKLPVAIHLYDGYGKPLRTGGAVLTARMFNTSQKAFATAPVTDHGNGTYTAVFEALWTGKADITVHIAHTPEMIRAQYYMRKKLHCLRCIDGVFSVLDKRNIMETTRCYPFVDVLKNSSDVAICNLTGDNSGMPWYCIRPRNIHLLCEDWAGLQSRSPVLPLTSCEGALLDRARQDIPHTLTIHVVKAPDSQFNIVGLPTNPCSKFNKADLWTLKQPSGFMHGGQWMLRHCKGIDDTRTLQCLRNKKVLIFGDSTSRFWYSHILGKWRCKSTSEAWTTGKYHKRASCANVEYNFTVQWLPHSQPNYNEKSTRYTTTSITRHLDETGNDEHVVALIHMYVHMLPYHHRVFRLKMHKIRLHVVDLLKRNKNAFVLIKGPHTMHEKNDWTRRRSDFYVPVYKHILYEEFMGLHDKVVFLDHKDVSDALVPREVHPPDPAVAAMVKQMLDYIC